MIVSPADVCAGDSLVIEGKPPREVSRVDNIEIDTYMIHFVDGSSHWARGFEHYTVRTSPDVSVQWSGCRTCGPMGYMCDGVCQRCGGH